MPSGLPKGRPTTRRCPVEEKVTAVPMVGTLRAELALKRPRVLQGASVRVHLVSNRLSPKKYRLAAIS